VIKSIFSCPCDIKKHVSTTFFTPFIIKKYPEMKIINILSVEYTNILTNGRIRVQKKMRFDENFKER